MEIQIRRASLADVQAIVNVTRDFGSEGIMIPLSIGDALERIRNFQVAQTPDGNVVGCVAIDPTWDSLVELRSLAVTREWHKHGIGRMLVDSALADARELGANEIFTLTYVPDFFKRFGFDIVDRNTLPHKVWLVCVKCPKFPDCGEVPMKLQLSAPTTSRSVRSYFTKPARQD